MFTVSDGDDDIRNQGKRIRERTSTFLRLSSIVKFLLAGMVAPFGGFTNLEDGILLDAGMSPIGAPLQDPYTRGAISRGP
jgi:hypothetical protein